MITGEYLLGDLWISPIFGLMFGPYGALGQALATLVGELYQGLPPIESFIDFSIMFFISIFTYKLWYTTFKRHKITTPRFDSIYNVLKFIAIIGIMAIVYWILINISLLATPYMKLAYPLSGNITRIAYIVNIFTFSIIFGLILISSFNILKIPLQAPKKFDSPINIPYKYYVIIALISGTYLLLDRLSIIHNTYLNNIFFMICIIFIILFCLNRRDETIEVVTLNYSIIEEIILIFMLILSITLIFNYSNFKNIINFIFPYVNSDFLLMIILAISSIVVILLSILHIYYVDRSITHPIYQLIDSTKEYQEHEKENKKDFKLDKYIKPDDDIGMLVKSFMKLKTLINENLNDLETTTAEKERIETELNIASNIQTSMLPKDFNEFSNNKPFEIHGFMSAAKEVGGDFYDFFNTDKNCINFVIGDVSGKGMPATLFMVKTMHLIRNKSEFRDKLSQVYEDVNNAACERNEENLFITSWIGKLDLDKGKLTYVNAGHNPPLIKQNNEEFEYLNSSANLVLGLMEGMPYEEYELNLNYGDMIFLYTDGLTEANDNYKEFYGEERLKAILNKHKDEKLSEIINEIIKDLSKFCNNQEQFDDITMLLLRYTGGEGDD
ncbi:PP2C family protein-serine/threonine phosphatase [Methanobrevibacter sp.]|uniref:PP2C family protein-serine/threonine phosphatase n=1 Tax=Methanobrevibacter sp. TaxID=66852 RepID=UPI0025F1731E|nr:PP2C family protein-serine/threonine phosphatase [Methanobrevibacter sp.]